MWEEDNMKTLLRFLSLVFLSSRVFSQGVQDGDQGSGGDELAEYAVNVNAQWNMVAVPTGLSDYLKTTVFPTATSGAITYEGGAFVTKDTLDNGPGYWLKFGSAQSISLGGGLIYTDSIPVSAGWNLVGSISDAIASSSVTPVGTSIQSSFFSFNNGYLPASTIEPGLGHWVKTSASGTLVISSGNFPKRSVQDTLEVALASLNTLDIRDAAGGRQTLYFGNADPRIQQMAELPPVPPSGIFDVRFASHSMIASDDQSILLSSVTYPVELQWNISSPGNYSLSIDNKETPLRMSGNIHISHPASHIALAIGTTSEVPKEFGLSQNYPNPFNPTTSIKFALPVQSRVTMELFSILGQHVATIVNDELPAGYHTISWNGRGDNHQQLGSGTYLLRLNAYGSNGKTFTRTRKMMMLK
jgi:hypothetical protein